MNEMLSHYLNNIDWYTVGSSVITILLAVILPILQYRFKKVTGRIASILKQIDALLVIMKEAYSDKKITAAELKVIVAQTIEILNTIRS